MPVLEPDNLARQSAQNPLPRKLWVIGVAAFLACGALIFTAGLLLNLTEPVINSPWILTTAAGLGVAAGGMVWLTLASLCQNPEEEQIESKPRDSEQQRAAHGN